MNFRFWKISLFYKKCEYWDSPFEAVLASNVSLHDAVSFKASSWKNTQKIKKLDGDNN